MQFEDHLTADHMMWIMSYDVLCNVLRIYYKNLENIMIELPAFADLNS